MRFQATFSDQMARALDDLRCLVREHFPEATFTVARAQDDADVVHLYVTVDVEDPDNVVDKVLDRMMALQIDEGLPIYVIPLRPPERVAEELRARSTDGT